MSRIPRLLHYVWVGGKPIPKRFQQNIETWKKWNPDYRLIFWNEENIDWSNRFIREAYDQKAWAKLSDLVRLQAVQKHGGVYLDTDVEVIRPLDTLLNCECFFGRQSLRPEDDPVCNAVFGATPNHWFINRLIDSFPLDAQGKINDVGTGPELLTALLSELGCVFGADERIHLDGVDIFPTRFFYPYHWNENYKKSLISRETLMVHHWDMSWHHDEEASSLRTQVIAALKSKPRLYRSFRSWYHVIRDL